jgi:uncharacterized protein YggE
MEGMKRLPLLIVLAAAVIAAAAFAGVGRPEAARGDATAADAVTTVGHGVVTVAPDEATVTAGVHTQAASAAEALAQNATLMNAVVAALKQHGGRDLQTQQVSLYPQTDQNGKVQSYVADNTVSATADIAGAGQLIDAAVAAGANTVSGPTLGVSDRDARYRQALAKAVDDARAKAEALAKAGNFVLGPVSVVTEQSAGVPPIVEAVPTAAKTASTPVEPGTQDIAADVSVTFRIG